MVRVKGEEGGRRETVSEGRKEGRKGERGDWETKTETGSATHSGVEAIEKRRKFDLAFWNFN